MHSRPTLNTEMGALLDFYGLTRLNTTYKAQTVGYVKYFSICNQVFHKASRKMFKCSKL